MHSLASCPSNAVNSIRSDGCIYNINSILGLLVVLYSSGIQDFTNNEDTSSLNEIGATFQTVNTQELLRQNTGLAAAATMTEAGKTLEGSEAEVVLLPLRLAFETKQSKIIEPALDCLHVGTRDGL